MGIRSWIDRLLSATARPIAPAPSEFGPAAERAREEAAKVREFERQVDKERFRRGLGM